MSSTPRRDPAKHRAYYLANKVRIDAQLKAYRDSHKEQYEAHRIRLRYGITPEYRESLLVSQNGVCAICRMPETMMRKGRVQSLCVDHCHKTGKIRGLLCHACNVSVGQMREDPSLLRLAADYIERHSVDRT